MGEPTVNYSFMGTYTRDRAAPRIRGISPLRLLPFLLALLVSPAHGATKADLLRGAYGPYRANNDLLFYHLDVRVDPADQHLQGKNTIRFKMLKDGKRIQLDLHPALHIDKILWNGTRLRYRRDAGAEIGRAHV